MDDAAERIARTAADIDAALAALPDLKVPYEPVRGLPPGRLRPNDAPMTFDEASRVASFRMPSALPAEQAAKLADEQDAKRRRAWAARFAQARASIPSKFDWLFALAPSEVRAEQIAPHLARFLPWVQPSHVTKLWRAWRDRVSILICGDAGLGKTTLALVHARWTFALASYDATAVRERREACDRWSSADKYPPPEPEWLPAVSDAQGLRFVSSTDLLATNQRDVDERAVTAALQAPVLYLDEVTREMYGARGDTYLANARRPAVSKVAENFWRSNKRIVATSPLPPEQLADVYDGGTFRRLVEERSSACVIDLNDDAWAGAWKREREREKRAKR